MPKTLNLKQLEKESRRRFSEDGLLYVFTGLLLLLVGASFAIPGLAPLAGFSAFLIFPVEILRRRLTYPRLGYARFSLPPGTIRGILGFTLLTVIALAFLAFAGNGRFEWTLPLAISVVFALAFYFGMSLHGLRPIDWLIIIVTLCAGLLATGRFDDWHDGVGVLFAIVGLLMLAVGLLMLVLFLRKYPVLENGAAK